MTPTEERSDAAGIAAQLERAIERALAIGGRQVYRLGSSQTSVTFFVGEDEHAAVTVLLDRQPPVVRPGSEPAEIGIYFTTDQARQFIQGTLIVPNEVLVGSVTTRGPVRRYLSCDAVLRALLARASRGEG